ncbi:MULTISPECIES: RNA-binding S4 domain-containing protein [Roseomonadaceae]|uniref:RNA-binding S4 domain-containing protein n=1 Tax=Falsiroseomonas oleicola TaxID=2801474 RepID=A0ABS6H6Z4_9PROT|nr:RNA-binding S4 domain-containing protein [Roseomonas oleicola]MBU8543597.1 RNA-binding S4 domain-containing protein [Roseomonas oleicola]
MEAEPAFQRLDLWLWCARIAKTRGECARQVSNGRVRVNSQRTDKPHYKLRPGDVLTLAMAGEVRIWRVLALAARRGPASEARGLYEDLSDPAPEGRSGPEPA